MKKLFYLFYLLGLPFSVSFAQTNTWVPAASMPIGLYDHAAALLPNGTVLITGGYSTGFVSLTNTEVYNPITNSWTNAAPLLAARATHTSTQLANGNVLVIGGRLDTNLPSTTVQRYSPATNSWTYTNPLTIPRTRATATLLQNGKVLVVGGNTNGGTYFDDVTNSCELYDPTTESWSIVAPMNSRRSSHSATLLPDGKVLVTGGGQDLNSPVGQSTTEIYDPSTNQWTTAAPMNDRRFTHKSVLLTNGNVLVIGGSYNSSSDLLNSCEMYNPQSNTWSSAVSLPENRGIHTATTLPSGNVFVTGGISNPSSDKTSTLLFDIAPVLTNVQISPSASVPCGQSVTLTATTSYSLGPYSYTITNGSTLALSGTATGTSFSQQFIPEGGSSQSYTLTIETDYARVSATAPTIQIGTSTITNLIVSGPASCGSSARLTATATSNSFVFTGPGGYVFSNVYRNTGSYTAFAEGLKLGGTYTLTVSNGGGCPPSIRTIVVEGPASCP